MSSRDVDAELRRLADDRDFPHRVAARHAVRFRVAGDVADLVAVHDDAHPCGMTEMMFCLAGSGRTWLNWVPLPTEAIARLADRLGRRRAPGEPLEATGVGLPAAEPASAVAACRRVTGPLGISVAGFPAPDIRVPLRPGRYAVWRYDGCEPVPAGPPPPAVAVAILHEVAAEPWQSLVSGYRQAAPLGELSLADLLGLLGHLPAPPATSRWRQLAASTPTYWFRLLQPWVCLGLLHHAEEEPWLVSTRREVLIDLAFGVEDWVADAALFALVAAAYRAPEVREEVRLLVRLRLDAAVAAGRLVTIGESVAKLMLIAPGCRPADRAVALAALAGAESAPSPRRWWRRRGRSIR